MDSMTNIGLIGFMATGKTTVGKALAASLGREFRDTDQIIEHQEGKSISEIFSESGEMVFREIEARVVREVCQINSAVISFGGGALLYPSSSEIISKRTQVVLLRASVATIAARAKSSELRPLLPEGETKRIEQVKQLLAKRSRLYDAIKDIEVCTDTMGVSETVVHIRRRLGL